MSTQPTVLQEIRHDANIKFVPITDDGIKVLLKSLAKDPSTKYPSLDVNSKYKILDDTVVDLHGLVILGSPNPEDYILVEDKNKKVYLGPPGYLEPAMVGGARATRKQRRKMQQKSRKAQKKSRKTQRKSLRSRRSTKKA